MYDSINVKEVLGSLLVAPFKQVINALAFYCDEKSLELQNVREGEIWAERAENLRAISLGSLTLTDDYTSVNLKYLTRG